MVKYNLLHIVNGLIQIALVSELKMHKVIGKYLTFNLKRHVQATKII